MNDTSPTNDDTTPEDEKLPLGMLCKEGVAIVERRGVKDIYVIRIWDLWGAPGVDKENCLYSVGYAMDDCEYMRENSISEDPIVLHKTDNILYLGKEDQIVKQMDRSFIIQAAAILDPNKVGLLPIIRAWIKHTTHAMAEDKAIAWAGADFLKKRTERTITVQSKKRSQS